jgi:polyphosphate kinase 2 (PPK2 family)
MLFAAPRLFTQGNYMKAYSELLPETSRPWAPWYVIPADHKPYCQMVVCDIVRRAVEGLNLSYVTPFHSLPLRS